LRPWRSYLRKALMPGDYNWQRDNGQTIHFLVNNNSLGQALVAKIAEFEKRTGITINSI
jgi:hypothetical protein